MIQSGYISGEPGFTNLSSEVKTMLEKLLNVPNRDSERNRFYLLRSRAVVRPGAQFSRIRLYSWLSCRPYTMTGWRCLIR